VNRLSLPDAATARDATGYERGTITPFGTTSPWPVVADERLRGRTVSLGARERDAERDAAVVLDADAALTALQAQVADVTEPVG
jgi:Cys-tRNA(Pro)/Cys-tRNA(Cys) deacylase